MSAEVYSGKSGGKSILLGNEAIVRGALESGVQYASTYPGTPASEIGDTFSKIAKDAGVYFEYSTNEKVAFESAAGAAFSGIRSMVAFKHFGLNVAADSVAPVSYVGVEGGFVIAFSDDPNGWSSAQSEQDSRCYSRLTYIPMLEPSNSQECIDFVKIAFDLSEKFKTPVFIRLTTRVSHTRGIVEFDDIEKGDRKAEFVKDIDKYNNLPPKVIQMHKDVIKRTDDIRKMFEEHEINRIVNEGANDKFGVITSGVSFNYIMDAMNDLDIELPVLKLGMTFPLPENRIKEFIKDLETLMVVEELEPVMEKEINILAREVNPDLKIIGKRNPDEKYFPTAGEYTTEIVLKALGKALEKELDFDYDSHMDKYSKIEMPRRFPVFCPGCPHRATFYAVKKAAGEDAVFGGDIGCYILGIFPPFETQDYIISMGASEGIGHGIKKAVNETGNEQKVITFLGDSTFFHAGIPPLINMVVNKSNALVVVMDNRITAMTGHQPHPGTGVTGRGDPTKEIKIEDIVKACGVEHVKVVDPFDMEEMEKTVKEFLDNDTVSVIVAKRQCYLLDYRDRRKKGIKIPKFEIAEKLTDDEKEIAKEYACPAYRTDEKDNYEIDSTMCWGCASCVKLFEKGKIKPKKD